RCGGDIETKAARCEELLVKYQHETGTQFETLGGEDDISCGLAFAPVTTASVSPGPVNGWYRNPTGTLSATDRGLAVAPSQYLLEPAPGWTISTGPFQVTSDGEYLLEYRSVDKAGHVEAVQTLALRVDAPPPVISGMPVSPCTIWPPDNKLVQIASVK